jgi:hypothetical protein
MNGEAVLVSRCVRDLRFQLWKQHLGSCTRLLSSLFLPFLCNLTYRFISSRCPCSDKKHKFTLSDDWPWTSWSLWTTHGLLTTSDWIQKTLTQIPLFRLLHHSPVLNPGDADFGNYNPVPLFPSSKRTCCRSWFDLFYCHHHRLSCSGFALERSYLRSSLLLDEASALSLPLPPIPPSWCALPSLPLPLSRSFSVLPPPSLLYTLIFDAPHPFCAISFLPFLLPLFPLCSLLLIILLSRVPLPYFKFPHRPTSGIYINRHAQIYVYIYMYIYIHIYRTLFFYMCVTNMYIYIMHIYIYIYVCVCITPLSLLFLPV